MSGSSVKDPIICGGTGGADSLPPWFLRLLQGLPVPRSRVTFLAPKILLPRMGTLLSSQEVTTHWPNHDKAGSLPQFPLPIEGFIVHVTLESTLFHAWISHSWSKLFLWKYDYHGRGDCCGCVRAVISSKNLRRSWLEAYNYLLTQSRQDKYLFK